MRHARLLSVFLGLSLLAPALSANAARAAAKPKAEKLAAAKAAAPKKAKPAAEKNGALRQSKELDAYLTKNKLKAREVKINLPGRKLARVFVPVLPTTYASFTSVFNEEHGTIYLRHNVDLEHPTVNFAKNRGFTHEKMWQGAKGAVRVVDPNGYYLIRDPINEPGRFLTLNFDQKTIAFLDKHWQNVEQGPQNNKSGCMWWLVHAEAGKDLPLAHALGVSRSGATSNFIKKMMHAGNEHIGVIGVPVPTLAAFNKLTDNELMGPPPGGGALEAVR